MKKWKQLVVFAMILTMVMGMVSFAATESGSQGSTGESTSANAVSSNTVSGGQVGGYDVTTVKPEGTTAKDAQGNPVTVEVNTYRPENVDGTGLVEKLANKVKEVFQNATAENTKLALFDVKCTTEGNITVTFDCSSFMQVEDNATAANFKVLHFHNNQWNEIKGVTYVGGKLTATFDSFSPVCIVYNAVVSEDNTGDNTQGGGDNTGDNTQGGGDNTGDNTQGGGDNTGDNTQGGGDNTGDNTQGGGDNTGDNNQGDNNTSKPSRPTITTDDWHLTYEPMAANKYNVLVLKWDAYVGGKVEVQCSTTPENPDSFRPLTTTKKTTYKFKKMEVGIEYGFRIVPKSAPEKASQILYVTREVSEIGTTAVTATAKTYNSVSVKWNKIPGVKRYAIYRTNTKTNETEVFVKSGTKLTDKRLTPGIEYRYQVAPIRVTGMKSDIPAESRILSAPAYATPELKAITGLKVTAVDSGTLKVSWRRVKGATHYTVDEVVMVDGVETLVRVAGYDQPLNRTQVKFSSLSANSEHTYVVTAYGGSYHTDPVRKAGRTKIAK